MEGTYKLIHKCNLNQETISTYRNYKFKFVPPTMVLSFQVKTQPTDTLMINKNMDLLMHKNQIQERMDYVGNKVDT